jgi:hypothetical protein
MPGSIRRQCARRIASRAGQKPARGTACRSPTWVLGGFAERIAAPAAALHAMPEGLPFEAAAMVEPLAAAVHALGRGSDTDDVGVLGGGSIGLMLAGMLVRERRSVLVADRHAERRGKAIELGARAGERLDKHELVFEAIGRPEAWRAAVDAAAPAGWLFWPAGACGEARYGFPRKRCTTRSSSCAAPFTTGRRRLTGRSRCWRGRVSVAAAARRHDFARAAAGSAGGRFRWASAEVGGRSAADGVSDGRSAIQ